MDIEFNNKLKEIKKRNSTEVWNDNCENDPEYKKLLNKKYGIPISFNAADESEKEKESQGTDVSGCTVK